MGRTDNKVKTRMYLHREIKGMCEHSKQKGCTGFKVKILQEITPGQDIIAVEDLWIILNDQQGCKVGSLCPV